MIFYLMSLIYIGQRPVLPRMYIRAMGNNIRKHTMASRLSVEIYEHEKLSKILLGFEGNIY